MNVCLLVKPMVLGSGILSRYKEKAKDVSNMKL